MDPRNDAADATLGRACGAVNGSGESGAAGRTRDDRLAVESRNLPEYVRCLEQIRASLREEIRGFQAHLVSAYPDKEQQAAAGDPGVVALQSVQVQSVTAALLRISEQIAALALEAQALASTRQELDLARERIDESEAAVQRLEGSLRRRFEELGALTAMLVEREAELEDACVELRREHRRVHKIERSLSWRITAPVRRCVDLLTSLGGRARSRDIALIEASDMFNAVWYLKNNPDVAASGIDPAEHYLRFGAREGRNPGPGFDTDWYLESNLDVDGETVNPLVHYLRHGRHEGRAPRR